MIRKIALAYSGGLDTSIIVPWLRERYDAEIICVAADIGQGDELDGVRAKAIASGADECFIEDMREEFVTDYIWPTLRAGAIYGRKYLLGTSMARPLIAKRQVDVARAVGADALAHGCTGKGNDQAIFDEVDTSDAVFAADLVELLYQGDGAELLIVDGHRSAGVEADGDVFRAIRCACRVGGEQEEIRRRDGVRVLENPAFV